MSLIQFWSGFFAWLGILYYIIDYAVYDRLPWHDSRWSKTIILNARDKEWEE